MAATWPSPTYTNGNVVTATDMNIIRDNLDDLHTEGTFTPTVYGATVAGTTTYTTQTGRYARVGNRIDVWLRVTWTAQTGSGSLTVGGLPFTSKSTFLGSMVVFPLSFTFAGSGIVAFLSGSRTYLELYSPASGGGGLVAMDTAADLIISGTYTQ